MNIRLIKNYISLLLLISIAASSLTMGQDHLSSGILEQQYNTMLEKSETYQQYKVIPRSELRKFRSNFKDSLSRSKAELFKSESTIEIQLTEIDQLKSELGITQNQLQETNKEKDSIKFFGISMSKIKYKGLMWTLLGLSLAALLFFIYRYKTSNTATHGIRKQLDETQLAFDAYKKRALDKEQKISRMLQDELNRTNKK